MTVGLTNKCSYCKRKLFGCKLKDTAHIHAEINGMEIVAKIQHNDTLMKFLQKLESTPYEPSMKSMERKCEDGLCREKSFYNLRDSIRKQSRGWSSRCKKCQSCTSWFRKRIGSPRKRAKVGEDIPPLERSGSPTEPEKYPLVHHRDSKKKVAYADDDEATTPYTSLRSTSVSSVQDVPKKNKKSKRKCKLFKSKRKKGKTAETASTGEENTEGDTSAESKNLRKSSKRNRRKSKSNQKKNKTEGRSSPDEENTEGDTSVESKKLRKTSKRNRRKSKSKQKKNKTVGRSSTEEENTERDTSVESQKLKKSPKRNRRKSKTKQDKKCQTSILYPNQGGETKIRKESINYARLIHLNKYQNYQISKNPLVTLPVFVNLKHLFYGKKYTTEKKHAVT